MEVRVRIEWGWVGEDGEGGVGEEGGKGSEGVLSVKGEEIMVWIEGCGRGGKDGVMG